MSSENFATNLEVTSTYAGLEVMEFKAEQPKSESPVVFIPGLWETPAVYEKSATAMAAEGRSAYVFEDPIRALAGSSEIIAAEADALAEAMSAKWLSQKPSDVVAHSKGALTAVELASRHPELVRSLILIGGAGLIGEDSLPRLMGRFTRKLAIQGKEMIADRDSRKPLSLSGKEAIKESSKHPVVSNRRISAIAKSNIIDKVASIKDAGIPVVIMQGNRDAVFPMKKIQQMLSKDVITGLVTFGSKPAKSTGLRGYHDDDHIKPGKIIPAIDALLTSLHQEDA